MNKVQQLTRLFSKSNPHDHTTPSSREWIVIDVQDTPQQDDKEELGCIVVSKEDSVPFQVQT